MCDSHLIVRHRGSELATNVQIAGHRLAFDPENMKVRKGKVKSTVQHCNVVDLGRNPGYHERAGQCAYWVSSCIGVGCSDKAGASAVPGLAVEIKFNNQDSVITLPGNATLSPHPNRNHARK